MFNTSCTKAGEGGGVGRSINLTSNIIYELEINKIKELINVLNRKLTETSLLSG